MYPKAPRNPLLAGSTPLQKLLCDRIRASGPERFSAFMEAALYWPGLGYYARERSPWGGDGDYITAPQVSPALARGLARTALEVAAAMPAGRFDLVEFGSGDGSLMRDLLGEIARLDAELFGRLRATCVERSATSRRRLEATVHPPPGGLRALPGLQVRGEPAPLCGMAFSNEFLDALPVERLRRRAGRLQQSWVDVDDGRLVERFREPIDAAVARHLEDNAIVLAEGQVAEVCLGVEGWMGEVASALRHGVLITVDYGHETAALYGDSRRQGTLLCQRRYALSDEPLLSVGEQDITAHVDFGHLRRLGAARGLGRGELCSLRVFLIGTGAAAGAGADARQQLGLRHLLVSELGDTHRVMLQTRGPGLEGLRFGRQRLEDGPLPSC